jgi:hypothetical protein
MNIFLQMFTEIIQVVLRMKSKKGNLLKNQDARLGDKQSCNVLQESSTVLAMKRRYAFVTNK